ncbi:MAG: hypothetical protein GWP10_08265 [Nitrospiraceae bacterium]|nr:hypothetical protein [Nitrospiraceae bacterium]
MGIETIKEKVFTKDELTDAYNDGYEQGAMDQCEHRGYNTDLQTHDAWDRWYATGYDHGFSEQAERDC